MKNKLKLFVIALSMYPIIGNNSNMKSRVHVVKATYYNPVRSQCDKNPLITADGSKINIKKLKSGKIRWVAVSRDLKIHYKFGDTIIVMSSNKKLNGEWVIRDTMNKKYRNRIDFLSNDKNFMEKPEKVKIRKKV